jgi:hypothetical protein
MDPTRFDRLALAVDRRGTRRATLGLLAALGITGLVREDAAAVCLPDGERCGGDRETCCSGYCKKKGGSRKKFCRQAPDQGICTIEDDFFTGNDTSCDDGTGTPCLCMVTSRGYAFCASFNSDVACFNCKTNADCEKRTGPQPGQPGDRCIQTVVGSVDCADTNNRACAHKCPDPATP